MGLVCAADQVQACYQHANRESNRHRSTAELARPRRRRDRIMMFFAAAQNDLSPFRRVAGLVVIGGRADIRPERPTRRFRPKATKTAAHFAVMHNAPISRRYARI